MIVRFRALAINVTITFQLLENPMIIITLLPWEYHYINYHSRNYHSLPNSIITVAITPSNIYFCRRLYCQ